MATPIIVLPKGVTSSRFLWNVKAEKAFSKLKRRFCSQPILITPSPSLPFIVEVDSSEVRVGAILSQRSPFNNKLHPCSLGRFAPAERNYDIGDRELLAVKLPLEEGRHWLEGAEHPFVVWTDHRNLLYIQQVKRRNS